MINIDPTSILALMVLLHLIADYTLQGCLASLKQKKWWEGQIPKNMKESDRYEMFKRHKNDYKCGLVCHGMYWSLVVCLPLLMTGGPAYPVNALIHGIVHSIIDDKKANKMTLNLIEDQIIHAIQIISIWGAWMIAR